jgi:hypothetical protein
MVYNGITIINISNINKHGVIMGRKISPLSSLEESLAKKMAIEKILDEARILANTNAVYWLPQRRYIQKVLWSISLAELKKWTTVDTGAILAKLQGKDPKSRQIAKLEELVRAEATALFILSGDNGYLEKSEQGIAEAREAGR